jgi:hypothetical protein
VEDTKVFSPTDAELDSLKNNFKFGLKLTLRGSYMFQCEKHHNQGAHYEYLSLAEVTVVKMNEYNEKHVFHCRANNNICRHTAE